MKNKTQSESRNTKGNLAKVLSVIALLSAVFAPFFWIMSFSYGFELDSKKFELINTSYALSIASVISIAFLGALQNDYYWILRRKKVKFDERVLAIRNRVFEKSYKILAISALILFILFSSNIDLIAKDYGSISPTSGWLFFSTMFFVYGLPSIIAAWEKDS